MTRKTGIETFVTSNGMVVNINLDRIREDIISGDPLLLFNPWENFHRNWQIICCGRRFEVRSYGMCYWSKIIFLWENGVEFYKLERNVSILSQQNDENIPRTEYFNGLLIRQYTGPRNCFLEFCQFLRDDFDYPVRERFLEVAKALALDNKIADRYGSFYKQCFFH